jgi:hypothetical protein
MGQLVDGGADALVQGRSHHVRVHHPADHVGHLLLEIVPEGHRGRTIASAHALGQALQAIHF